MTREIKFRAWFIRQKKLSSPFTIELMSSELQIEIIKGNVILMQFTGLLDKNSKEIYEGDIIKRKTKDKGIYRIEKVYWVNRTGFNPFHRGLNVVEKTPNGLYGNVEVIGNIMENPDLIKN